MRSQNENVDMTLKAGENVEWPEKYKGNCMHTWAIHFILTHIDKHS